MFNILKDNMKALRFLEHYHNENLYLLLISSKFPSPEFESLENCIGEGGKVIGCWLSAGWGDSRSAFSAIFSCNAWLIFNCDPFWCSSIEKSLSGLLSLSDKSSRIALYSWLLLEGEGGWWYCLDGGDERDVSTVIGFDELWDVSPLVVGTRAPKGEAAGDKDSLSISWWWWWWFISPCPFMGLDILASRLLISRLLILKVLILMGSFLEWCGGEAISGGSMIWPCRSFE